MSVQLPTDNKAVFRAAPVIERDQPGFDFILELLDGDDRFAFCKLNHGFWERLVSLEKAGINRHIFLNTPGKEIDAKLGISGSMFAEGGMLFELLDFLKAAPSPSNGLHFVASLAPWPETDRIEGTPFQNYAHCLALMEHFVPKEHRDNVTEKRFSGHEFKVAAITGGFRKFCTALRNRDVIFIGNDSNRALIDAHHFPSITVIEVDAQEARLSRDGVRQRLFEALARRRNADRPPVVIGAAGGSMTTWLAFHAWREFERFQFVDLGGTLAAYHAKTALRMNWTKAYQRQLSIGLSKLDVSLPDVEILYSGRYGLRDEDLVELAVAAGVPVPQSNDELAGPLFATPIPFIENKLYDHQRMAELLSLSIAANHHANGGPVATLLECMVATRAKLPRHRRVVAISNGTAALHVACGFHALETTNPGFRWIASAFNFFSCKVGPLSATKVIDCDRHGRFDLEGLKSLPLSSYDGVIYTNVFARQSDWDDVAEYCKRHDKKLVIDNATGLLDRPISAASRGTPIETISAHHTKPWGIGEGGFIVCDADEEPVIRKLLNFAAQLPSHAAFCASNYKLSDLAAAAIIDRLERMPYWNRFYQWQERRMHSLVIDTGLDISPFRGTDKSLSPRAHTPFLCHVPVDINAVTGPITLRKYYRPLRLNNSSEALFTNAENLFAHIFSLSNAPEMRLVSNSDIVAQVTRLVEAGMRRAEKE